MNLATEPLDSRRDVFAIVAERRGLLPVIIEKDFWVCWTLERLFSLPALGEHLLFKGGTSLSKVYGIIHRFSEDIDLSLSRAFFGSSLGDPEKATSNTKRKKYTEALIEAFQDTVTVRLLPSLSASIAEEIGPEGWTLRQDTTDPGTLHFFYPRSSNEEIDYIRPEVRIELGGRSDDEPVEDRTIVSYVAIELPQVMPGAIHVRALAARRTFWEKATILHAEYHRPLDRPAGERLSRHYSDLAQMADTDIEMQALADLPLLERVRAHKTTFYASSWASYETARPGTLHLIPHPDRQVTLRSDYRGMESMFFGAVLSFDDVLKKLEVLEERINALTA